MSDVIEQTIHIDARPDMVMAVISNIDRYLEWAPQYKEVQVMETDTTGRVIRARLTLDALVFTDSQVCDFTWAPDGLEVSWVLSQSKLVRSLEGSYHLIPQGSGTLVGYKISIDPKFPVARVIRRRFEREITNTALRKLKERVESLSE